MGIYLKRISLRLYIVIILSLEIKKKLCNSSVENYSNKYIFYDFCGLYRDRGNKIFNIENIRLIFR